MQNEYSDNPIVQEDLGTIAKDSINAFMTQFSDTPGFESFSLSLEQAVNALNSAMKPDQITVRVPFRANGTFDLVHSTFPKGISENLEYSVRIKGTRGNLCLESKQARFYKNLDTDPKSCSSGLLERADLTQMWVVPLCTRHTNNKNKSEDRVLAIANLLYKKGRHPNRFSNSFVEFLGIFIGREIERALWEEDRLILLEASAAIDFTGQDKWSRLYPVAEKIAERMRFESCTILLADESRKQLQIAGTTGIDSSYPISKISYRIPNSLKNTPMSCTGRIAINKKPEAIEDLNECDWYKQSDHPDKVKSKNRRQYLGAPIMADGQLVGVIRLRNKIQPNGSWLSKLNHLDVLRIKSTATLIAPLLSLRKEQKMKDEVISRSRHDTLAPANMIRNFADYYRSKTFHEITNDWNTFKLGLINCAWLAEVIQFNALMTRYGSEGEIPLVPEKTQMWGEFVCGLCERMTPGAKKKKLLGIHTDNFAAIPALWIDRIQMKIVIYNLLDNAIKYSYPNTEIKITTDSIYRDDQTWYQIYISSFGIVINESERDSLFQSHFRTDAAKRKVPAGVGKGLHIARTIVEKHGGRLFLKSLRDPVTFVIELPGTLEHGEPK